MAKRISFPSDAEYVKAWQEFRDNFRNATPVDPSETPALKLKRMKKLEADNEDWFVYYFPNYCTAEPADFHKRATKRTFAQKELFDVRAWSRELAKTARCMMETIKQAVTGDVKNVLLTSNSSANAERLLLPYKACFEANQRLINDYGKQERFGNWTSKEFITQKGCSFRALGWGESPRGTRNNQIRPDKHIIDDIDTDEECRNEEIMDKKVAWIEQALIGTRSISEPTQIIVCGNIIHENCAVKRLGEKADYFEIINIRDEQGKSTWPQKNSEAQIDRVLSLISYESGQKEYFNNPMDGSNTFKNISFGKVPPLKTCNVCIYADPATSNKDVSNASQKAVGVLANKGFDFFLEKVFLDTMSNAKFIDCLFDAYIHCKAKGVENVKVHIENNTLQNPFFEQVLLPLIYKKANETGVFLPITPDERKKGEKWTRIEGTLEPLVRLGHFVLNEKETENPHMKRCLAQFKNAGAKQKRIDGPDMAEGGVFKLQEQAAVTAAGGIETIQRMNTKKM